MTKQQQDPKLHAPEVYIVGDTLHHQPMGAGHVTMLQFAGTYEALYPVMVSPNHSVPKGAEQLCPDHHHIWHV